MAQRFFSEQSLTLAAPSTRLRETSAAVMASAGQLKSEREAGHSFMALIGALMRAMPSSCTKTNKASASVMSGHWVFPMLGCPRCQAFPAHPPGPPGRKSCPDNQYHDRASLHSMQVGLQRRIWHPLPVSYTLGHGLAHLAVHHSIALSSH